MPTSPDTEIVDYGDKDFREYWQGKSKDLLNENEQKIIQALLPEESRWFVDIGCGFGRLMPSYQKRQKNLVLVDYDLKHLRMASESTNRKNVYFIAADACRLPFRCEVIDGGICVRLMHHIADPELFIKELYRIFTKTSYLLLNYMNRRNMLRLCRYGPDCFRHTHERVSDIIFATHPAYYSQIAREAGFTIRSVRGTGLVHQLVHDSRAMAFCSEKIGPVNRMLTMTEHVADPILGKLNLALMQYTRLEKICERHPDHEEVDTDDIMEILRCPACWSVELKDRRRSIDCCRCGASYPREGRICDFRCNDKERWR